MKISFLSQITLLLICVLMSGCANEKPPTPDPLMREMLISTNDYPEGWQQMSGSLLSGETRDEIENIGVSYYFTGGDTIISTHTIRRYESAQFEEGDGAWKPDDIHDVIDEKLSDTIKSLSPLRNVQVICSRDKMLNKIYCSSLAKYANYSSVFTSCMGEDFMSVQEFVDSLNAIDAKFKARGIK